MKKTLAVAAVLAAFAGTAAADVTLYGRIDTSMVYSAIDNDAGDVTESIGMEAGWTTGSRWGIKGSEKISDDLTVGFVLESGFSGDTGKSGQGGRLFGRESVVYAKGDFGTIYAGRLGAITSDSGSLSLLGNASAFGNAYGLASMKYSTGTFMDRYDNVLAYVSPSFGGFNVQAMHSLKRGADKDEGTESRASAERFSAVGAKYQAGALTVVATADYTDYGAYQAHEKDGVNVVVGGNYKFDAFTAYGKVAYFDNVVGLATPVKNTYDGAMEGYGVELGAKVPAFGGNVKANVQYRQAEQVEGNDEYTLLAVNVGYEYPLSKMTHLYGAVGYAQEKAETAATDTTPFAYQAAFGIVHKF